MKKDFEEGNKESKKKYDGELIKAFFCSYKITNEIELYNQQLYQPMTSSEG